jgi:hypothetical protein
VSIENGYFKIFFYFRRNIYTFTTGGAVLVSGKSLETKKRKNQNKTHNKRIRETWTVGKADNSLTRAQQGQQAKGTEITPQEENVGNTQNSLADFDSKTGEAGTSGEKPTVCDSTCDVASHTFEETGVIAHSTAFGNTNNCAVANVGCLTTNLNTSWFNSVETSSEQQHGDFQHQDAGQLARGSFEDTPQYYKYEHELRIGQTSNNSNNPNNNNCQGNNINNSIQNIGNISSNLISPTLSDDVGYASKSTTPEAFNISVEDLEANIAHSEVDWDGGVSCDLLMQDVDFILEDGTEVHLVADEEQETVSNNASCSTPQTNLLLGVEPEEYAACSTPQTNLLLGVEQEEYAAGSSLQSSPLPTSEQNYSTADNFTSELDTATSKKGGHCG